MTLEHLDTSNYGIRNLGAKSSYLMHRGHDIKRRIIHPNFTIQLLIHNCFVYNTVTMHVTFS